MQNIPGLNVDILVVSNNKILLGLMTEKWNYDGQQVYGLPGRDIRFREKIIDTVKRNIAEEFNCNVSKHEVICVNANYALNGHYVGVGVVAEIDGDPIVLLPDDWVRWDWFDMDNIPTNLFPASKNLIDCYIKKVVNVSE